MHGDDNAQHQEKIGNAANPEHLERRAGFFHVADEQHRAHTDEQTFPEDQHDAQIIRKQRAVDKADADKIEQQKISLATWQNAQAEIQQHTRKKLMPVYSELHDVLFQQLDQLWMLLQQHEFYKAEMQQLDEKIAQLAQMLKIGLQSVRL